MFRTRDAWCVFVFMIQMIYSQQNISQLGVCPLSLDKYLPEATRGPWTRCSVQSVLCVCVCGLFRSRLFPSEQSHLEWTCFRNRTASYYLLFSDITSVLWQIHVSHFSTISVTRSKKKMKLCKRWPSFAGVDEKWQVDLLCLFNEAKKNIFINCGRRRARTRLHSDLKVSKIISGRKIMYIHIFR